MGGRVSTDFKSSNGIEISRFVKYLLHFYWLGGVPPGGGWVGLGLGGGTLTHVCMHMHAHMHMCAHTCMHVEHDKHGSLHGGDLTYLFVTLEPSSTHIDYIWCAGGGYPIPNATFMFRAQKSTCFLLLWLPRSKISCFCTGSHQTMFRLTTEQIFDLPAH